MTGTTSTAEPGPSPEPPVRIHTRTRSRAMEWSLVLASQEIAAVIEHDAELGWNLVVSGEEHARAVAAIDQFRRENRRWPWQREMPQAELVFDWAATTWLAITCVFFHFQSSLNWVTQRGALDSDAVHRGEWWRYLTATTLHADLLHLASNSLFGFILLGFAMGRFGTGFGLLAAFLAGVVGNLCSYGLHLEPYRSLGASGVVMGALGLLAAQSLRLFRDRSRVWKISTTGVAAGTFLFILLGLSPEADVSAHLGGFLAGLCLSPLLSRISDRPKKASLDLAALLVFLSLLFGAWWFAAHAHP